MHRFEDERFYPAQPLPVEAAEFILSTKQPAILNHLPNLNVDSQFSPEQHQIHKARIVGNLAIRIAYDSFISSENDSSAHFIGNLSFDDQIEELTRPLEAGHIPASNNRNIRLAISDSKLSVRTNKEKRHMTKAYFDVRTGKFPPSTWPRPSVSAHDAVFTQAFGRNSILDKDLAQIHDKRKELGDDELMMEYLDSIEFDAGASNYALADVIAERLVDPNVIEEHATQWEVVYALRDSYPEVYTLYKDAVHTLWPPRAPYRTSGVKADSVKLMDEVGLHNVLEFAHPDMMARALAILYKLDIPADPLVAEIPFDPNSVQRQIRSEREWIGREALTRVHHLVVGDVGRANVLFGRDIR